MRKLFALIGIFAIMPITAFALIASPMSNQFDATGTISNKEYVAISIKNGTGSTIAAGSLVKASATSDDGATIALTSSVLDVPLCMVEASCVNGAMCKCLVYGYTDVLLFDASATAVAGEGIYLSGPNNGYALAVASASVAAYMVRVGAFLDASAASGAVEAFINLL
jgi:hypothetical protein